MIKNLLTFRTAIRQTLILIRVHHFHLGGNTLGAQTTSFGVPERAGEHPSTEHHPSVLWLWSINQTQGRTELSAAMEPPPPQCQLPAAIPTTPEPHQSKAPSATKLSTGGCPTWVQASPAVPAGTMASTHPGLTFLPIESKLHWKSAPAVAQLLQAGPGLNGTHRAPAVTHTWLDLSHLPTATT